MRKYQIEIRRDMIKLWESVPKRRSYTEFEMEKCLHKYRVMARKQQIELAKLDNEIPYRPYEISSYMHKEKREKIGKVFWSYIRYYFLALKP